MKKSTKSLLRIVISIVYIVWGISSPLALLESILALNLSAILSAALGVLMLVAGVFGLLGIRRSRARVFGIVIFVLAVLSVISVFSSFSLGALVQPLVSAVLALLFITCI